MISHTERDAGLDLLNRRGAILDIAREVSRLFQAAGIDGAVIGGVAVVLHGHIRTTLVVDVFVKADVAEPARVLTENGFLFDKDNRQFIKNNVPVHLVRSSDLPDIPKHHEEIDGIVTVSLEDLINLKLQSGFDDILRAQDLADVIGLIRSRNLTGEFARHLDKSVRSAFRKFVHAVDIR